MKVPFFTSKVKVVLSFLLGMQGNSNDRVRAEVLWEGWYLAGVETRGFLTCGALTTQSSHNAGGPQRPSCLDFENLPLVPS